MGEQVVRFLAVATKAGRHVRFRAALIGTVGLASLLVSGKLTPRVDL